MSSSCVFDGVATLYSPHVLRFALLGVLAKSLSEFSHFSVAGITRRFWLARFVYFVTVPVVRCPMIAMISRSVHPASARAALAFFRRPSNASMTCRGQARDTSRQARIQIADVETLVGVNPDGLNQSQRKLSGPGRELIDDIVPNQLHVFRRKVTKHFRIVFRFMRSRRGLTYALVAAARSRSSSDDGN